MQNLNINPGGLMKIATVVGRSLLGLGFVVFGANLLHPFLHMPPFPAGSPGAQFMAVMGPSGYMRFVGIFEFLGGALALFGRTAPIGLSLLGPVLVNVLAFHVLLMGGEGLAPGLVFSALELFLVYSYRDSFAAIFAVAPAEA
jgi:uncharacterized membrane protein YphA (DoxX/SURF4 family)